MTGPREALRLEPGHTWAVASANGAAVLERYRRRIGAAAAGVARGPDTTAKGERPGVRCPGCGEHVAAADVARHGEAHRALVHGEGLIGSVWRRKSTGKRAVVVGRGNGTVHFRSVHGTEWDEALMDVVVRMELVTLGDDDGR